MGQKVNPHGLRVGVIKDWDSRWFAGKATFGDTLVEDYKIRDYIMNKRMLTRANGEKSDQQLSRAAGIAQVEIERSMVFPLQINAIMAERQPVARYPVGCECVIAARSQPTENASSGSL